MNLNGVVHLTTPSADVARERDFGVNGNLNSFGTRPSGQQYIQRPSDILRGQPRTRITRGEMMTRTRKRFDIYRGRDPREIPTYGISEAAHLLKIPVATLRAWIRGRYYETDRGRKRFEPLICLPDADLPLLSFVNLVEAHILDAIRYKHNVPLRNVRTAVGHLRECCDSEHPLADYWFQIIGVDLLIEDKGLIVNATRRGQLEMKEIITAYLKRVDRDPEGAAVGLYPYLKRHPRHVEEPKLVLIDPRVSFGKPVLVGVGVPTSVVADRYSAGETVMELADDYGCEAAEIQKAIEYERTLSKAA